jgi:hypothetical protein
MIVDASFNYRILLGMDAPRLSRTKQRNLLTDLRLRN